jgi:hypothetical protein
VSCYGFFSFDFEIFQVLNESYSDLASLKGAKFSQLFYNRRFDLPSRPVTISPNGMRIENVIVNQYKNESDSFLVNQSIDQKLP